MAELTTLADVIRDAIDDAAALVNAVEAGDQLGIWAIADNTYRSTNVVLANWVAAMAAETGYDFQALVTRCRAGIDG